MTNMKICATLLKIHHYFTNCYDNAADDSAAKATFDQYMKALDEAEKMLKTQEPRIMTVLDWEIEPSTSHVDKLPVWIEWSKSAKGECAESGFVDGWAVLNVDAFCDVLCFGGRCWTSRPTEEQRKAVKWDD